MKPLRCLIGLHRGRIVPAHNAEIETDRRCVFHCRRCGDYIE